VEEMKRRNDTSMGGLEILVAAATDPTITNV
jgi:hypothetical protein